MENLAKTIATTLLVLLCVMPSAYAADDSNFLYAVRYGNLTEVKKYYSQVSDINRLDDNHHYAYLHFAAIRGATDVTLFLIEHGGDVNRRDTSGYTPLHWAAYYGKKDVAELLISKGASLNAKSLEISRSDAPLHMAAEQGFAELVTLLVDKGADVNVKNGGQYTPLHVATISNKPGIVQLLIAKGANVNALNIHSNTPLHLAAEVGSADIVQILVDKGADIHSIGEYGFTPLFMSAAAKEKGSNVAALLISKGADVNFISGQSTTALSWAAYECNYDVAKLLTDNGAKIVADAKNGPLSNATWYCKEDIVRFINLIIDRSANINQLPDAQKALENVQRRIDKYATDGTANEEQKRIAAQLQMAKMRLVALRDAQVAAQGGNKRSEFDKLVSTVKDRPDDGGLRGRIIDLSLALQPLPVVPEDARKDFVRGIAAVKEAQTLDDFARAADLFQSATIKAPWWGDAYFNLAKAREMQKEYGESLRNLKMFMLTRPSESEARAAKDLIYVLEDKESAQSNARSVLESSERFAKYISYINLCDAGNGQCNDSQAEGKNWRKNGGGVGKVGFQIAGDYKQFIRLHFQTAAGTFRGTPKDTLLSNVKWEHCDDKFAQCSSAKIEFGTTTDGITAIWLVWNCGNSRNCSRATLYLNK